MKRDGRKDRGKMDKLNQGCLRYRDQLWGWQTRKQHKYKVTEIMSAALPAVGRGCSILWMEWQHPEDILRTGQRMPMLV